MAVLSAGLLVFRRAPRLEFLLAHPGGLFWARKDDGAWTIPKGLVEEGEDPRLAALREFGEETGLSVEGEPVALAPVKQKSGKVVAIWMVEANPALSAFHSNTFELELPRGSGRMVSFPEIDRIAWFAPDEAMRKILPGQAPILIEALQRMGPGAHTKARSREDDRA